MIKNIFNKNNIRARQIATLFSFNIIVIPIGIASNIIVTKYLGTIEFGNYNFLKNIFSLAIIIFDFGLFQAGNRALLLSENKKESREYYGAELLCLFCLFIMMSLALLTYANYDCNLTHKGLTRVFIYLIPCGWLFLLPRYYEALFQADNRINDLTLSRFLPSLVFFIFCLPVYYLNNHQNEDRLAIIFYIYLTPIFLVFCYLTFRIKPSFKNIRVRLKEIWKYNRSYGFYVYTGSLFAVGASQLSGVLISYFASNNIGVGYYSLALAFASPLKLIPNTIATTHYRDFSLLKSIPKKLTYITLALSLSALIFLSIIISPFIHFFYGVEFEPVINLCILVSIAMILYGLADYINRFLGAHGLGKNLRNSAFIVGITMLISNIILVSKFGEMGAVLSQIISGLIYLVNMLFFYKSFVKKM